MSGKKERSDLLRNLNYHSGPAFLAILSHGKIFYVLYFSLLVFSQIEIFLKRVFLGQTGHTKTGFTGFTGFTGSTPTKTGSSESSTY
jgi:hypothetical protein